MIDVKNQHRKELIQFILLYITSIIVVYYLPFVVNQLFFIVILFLFWRSKKNHFWFAYIFVILGNIGQLLTYSYNESHYVANYPIISGVVIMFDDLFFLVALIKAMVHGTKEKLIFFKPLKPLLIYLIILIPISFIYGISSDDLISNGRRFLIYTSLISLPFLLKKEEEYIKLSLLLFPLIFIVMLNQLYFLSTGNFLENIFTGGNISLSYGVRPSSISSSTVFFCYFFSLFFLTRNDIILNKTYLYIITTLSIFVIFLSATRSYIAMVIITMTIFVFKIKKINVLFLRNLLIGAIFVSIIIAISPQLQRVIDYSLKRFSTVEEFAKGDLTAGGTNRRFTERLPELLKGFKQHPITGVGYSNIYTKYYDFHVGNFNLLLQIGIVGFILFLYFIIKTLIFIRKVKLKLISQKEKSSLATIELAIYGLLLLHFTTKQTFGFYIHKTLIIFWVLFFSIASFYIKKASSLTKNEKNY